MSGLFDFLSPSKETSRGITAFLGNGGGLLERIAAYRQAKENSPAMDQQQALLQQAQQILADSYSPEQKATRDFVTVPAYRVAEDKPAAFDFDTAQKRLLGMGALGLAEKLAGVQEAQRKAANGGIDESFFAPQFGYDASGNLVPLQFSNRGNAKKGALPDGVTGLAFPNEYKDTGGAIVALPKYGFGAPKPVAAKTQSPDSIVSNDPVTQARLARAKAEASKVGEVEGDLAGKEKKQIVNASDILDALDEAEPLIKKSTGSGIGKVVDMGAGVFGMSTEGAEAGDQLAILGSKLTMMQPRFEGPQSDADTKSYREAAGNLANTAIPRERRLASLSLIRRLNQKYANGPIQAPAASKPAPGKLNARQQMDAIKQAQAAAARGANKAVINQRLRDMGISFQVK